MDEHLGESRPHSIGAPGPDPHSRNEASRPPIALRVLRDRWRQASLATGWRFPSDWPLPEVDEVCASVLDGADADVTNSLAKLGRARAATGAGLPETLFDLAALHAVLADPDAAESTPVADPESTPPRLLTTTVLAWVDEALEPLRDAGVTDSLTGLTTAAYLRARLAEVYRRADRDGQWADSRYVLLVISCAAGETSDWSRLAGMVLVADVVRSVFDSGQTLSALGSSTVAVLLERQDKPAAQAMLVRRLISERSAEDPGLRSAGVPGIRLVRLPADHERACELLNRLGTR